MATVDSRTTISIDELVNDTVISGQVVDGHLLLTTRGGDVIDAGVVVAGSDPVVNAYVHTQASAALVWVIDHPLAFRPNVTIVDNVGQQVEAEVDYITNNRVTITFSGAFAGTAYLS